MHFHSQAPDVENTATHINQYDQNIPAFRLMENNFLNVIPGKRRDAALPLSRFGRDKGSPVRGGDYLTILFKISFDLF